MLDGEPVLIAKFHDGGNHNWIEKTYYMFRANGWLELDFREIGRATAKLMPPNMSVRASIDDYESMTQILELARNDLNLPLVAVKERGRIIVSYRFVEGRAVVTSAEYESYSY